MEMTPLEIANNIPYSKMNEEVKSQIVGMDNDKEFIAFSLGALNAINGTYAKGINPEGCEPMRIALEKMLDAFETNQDGDLNNIPADKAIKMMKVALKKAMVDPEKKTVAIIS